MQCSTSNACCSGVRVPTKRFDPMLLLPLSHCGSAIDFAGFLELARRYPLAMFPLFKFQIHMQAATLGQAAWVSMRNRVAIVLETENSIKAITSAGGTVKAA